LMRYQAGEREGARQAWERSLDHTPTPWAMRNLAVLAREEGRLGDAIELYTEACRMRPTLLPLVVECGRALIDTEHPREWLDLVEELPGVIRMAGRVRLLEGQAALAAKDFDRVAGLFADVPVIDDLREGERSLSQLWFEYHEQRLSALEGVPVDESLHARVRREFPVPPEIDFRMHAE
jgi:tetratricopeptide (TPR) repeat protein